MYRRLTPQDRVAFALQQSNSYIPHTAFFRSGQRKIEVYTGKNKISPDVTNVIIPDAVTTIGYLAFKGCSRLTSLTIPDSVTSIGHNAFAGCTGLTSLTIPDSVTYIGHNAFAGCTGLTSIMIPNLVNCIEHFTFTGCTSLTSLYRSY